MTIKCKYYTYMVTGSVLICTSIMNQAQIIHGYFSTSVKCSILALFSFIQIYICIYVCVCMCICVYVCVCMYILVLFQFYFSFFRINIFFILYQIYLKGLQTRLDLVFLLEPRSNIHSFKFLLQNVFYFCLTYQQSKIY